MKAAKRQVLILLGISFTAAILVFLVTPVFMKNEYQITEEVIIKAHPKPIYNSIADLNKLAEWSALIQLYPNTKSFVNENTLFWEKEGSKVHLGEISVLEANQDSTVKLKVILEDYASSPEPLYTITKTDEGTKVTVTDAGKIPYFMRYFAIEEAISTQYKRGLANLKKYNE